MSTQEPEVGDIRAGWTDDDEISGRFEEWIGVVVRERGERIKLGGQPSADRSAVDKASGRVGRSVDTVGAPCKERRIPAVDLERRCKRRLLICLLYTSDAADEVVPV